MNNSEDASRGDIANKEGKHKTTHNALIRGMLIRGYFLPIWKIVGKKDLVTREP